MKVTGIALLVIGFALLLFAGVSHFALTPNADDVNRATTPSSPIFSPWLSFVVAVIAAAAGFLILRYGGRGYTEKTDRNANSQT